jgi:Nucleotidyl transferase AbiEii toxin, Type IV TA system
VQRFPSFSPRALLRSLVEGGVDFVVVGGIAAVARGSAAFTQDLDISYAPEQANLDRLGRVLVDLGARLRGVTDEVPFIPDGQTLKRTRVLTLETPIGSIDLLAEPDGAPEYRRLCERATREVIGGVEVQVASLEDLIAMKKAAGRPKDLVAVEELEAIQRLQRELDG